MHPVLLLLALAQQPDIPLNCAADGTVVNLTTGEPIARARVSVLQSGTFTDGVGHWQLNVPCGRLNISAMKAGFLPRAMGGMGTTTPDSPAHDVRLELVPQAVVTGRVIDENGEPLQNVQVSVMTSRVNQGKRVFAQAGGGITNDLGEYRIAGLPEGKVILCTRSSFTPLIQESAVADACYPGPVEGGSASAMMLPAGREARVDFTLRQARVVRLRGKITGMPEGAGVSLSLQSRTGGNGGRSTMLQKEGNFEVRAVPPGSWMLSVDYWEGGKRLMARVPVEVGGGDIDGIAVHLESGFPITGRVRVESQSGKQPKPQQIVLSLRAADIFSGAGAPQWNPDRTAFTINDAMPGNYELYGNLPAPFYLKSALLGGRDISREALPVNAGSGPIDVVIADDSGGAKGVLVDGNGDPAAGAGMLLQDGRPPVIMQAGADGRFNMTGIAPGDYKAYGWDEFQRVEYADAEWMRLNAGSGQAVTITAGQTADLKLTRLTVPRE